MENPTSCHEFLLTSFCKHFGIKPKQAAGLLAQRDKYLTHIIVRGLRGKAEPIIGWYQDMYASLKTIVQLIQKEKARGSLKLMLSALRPGLVSYSLEVAIWACRLFARFGSEFANFGLQPEAWEVGVM